MPMTPAVMADIAAGWPRAELLHGPWRHARVSTELIARTRTRSTATSTTVFVDQRHHGTRLARKVAAGIAAETRPTRRTRRRTRARVKRRFHGRARRITSH